MFRQAGWAFVDTRGRSGGQGGGFQRRVYALFVHGVARFVDRTEQPFVQKSFIDPGGDAHIADGKLGGEGVVGFVLAAPVEIIAQLPHNRLAKCDLRRFGIVSVQHGIVCGWMRHNRLHQRHQLCPQLGKECAHAGRIHAQIGSLDVRIDGFGIAGEIVGVAAAVFQRFFQ